MTPLRKRMTEHILLKGCHRAIKKYLKKFVAKKWSNILFSKSSHIFASAKAKCQKNCTDKIPISFSAFVSGLRLRST